MKGQRYKAMWHLNGWGKPVMWGVWDIELVEWVSRNDILMTGYTKETAEEAARKENEHE